MAETFRKKKVAILGLGVNNRALAAYLLAHHIPLTIRDKDTSISEAVAEEFAEWQDQITWEFLPDVTKNLEQFSVVFRSPGIPYRAAGIQKALTKGVLISSQTNLFFERCPATIIGVTGTKGKGTTCSLIYEMLKAGYEKGKVYLGGNIGVDPFSFLDQLTAKDLVVLELSSFQLEDLQKSPHIAVLLHVTVEHLDHHKDLAEYQEAKAQILAHQGETDIAIVNTQYPEMRYFLPFVKGKRYSYTRHTPARQSAWSENLEGKEVVFTQVDDQLESFEITGRKLRGEHNIENILPAVLVAQHYAVPPQTMQKVIREFKGLPHRLSLVGSYHGAEFYDDSIATTPDSGLVAVEAFPEKRLHLIAGGKDKGQEYEATAPILVRRCATISLLPGASTGKLKKALQRAVKASGSSCLILEKGLEGAADAVMENVINGIHPFLKEGDVVLLAPTAASDAPFKNYHERGQAYVQAIHHRYQS